MTLHERALQFRNAKFVLTLRRVLMKSADTASACNAANARNEAVAITQRCAMRCTRFRYDP